MGGEGGAAHLAAVLGRSGHRGAKHPVTLRATAPSTSASLEKHFQNSLTEMSSFWKVVAGKWYSHI